MHIVSVVNNYNAKENYSLQFFNMQTPSDGCALASPSPTSAALTLTPGGGGNGCVIPALVLTFTDPEADVANWQQNRMIIAGPSMGNPPWAGTLWGFSFFQFDFPADPYPNQPFLGFTYDVGPIVPSAAQINAMVCLAVPIETDAVSIIIDPTGNVAFTAADSAGNPVPALDPSTKFKPWWSTANAAAG